MLNNTSRQVKYSHIIQNGVQLWLRESHNAPPPSSQSVLLDLNKKTTDFQPKRVKVFHSIHTIKDNEPPYAQFEQIISNNLLLRQFSKKDNSFRRLGTCLLFNAPTLEQPQVGLLLAGTPRLGWLNSVTPKSVVSQQPALASISPSPAADLSLVNDPFSMENSYGLPVIQHKKFDDFKEARYHHIDGIIVSHKIGAGSAYIYFKNYYEHTPLPLMPQPATHLLHSHPTPHHFKSETAEFYKTIRTKYWNRSINGFVSTLSSVLGWFYNPDADIAEFELLVDNLKIYSEQQDYYFRSKTKKSEDDPRSLPFYSAYRARMDDDCEEYNSLKRPSLLGSQLVTFKIRGESFEDNKRAS